MISGIAVNPDPTNIDPTLTFTATDAANKVAVVEYYLDTYPDASAVWSSVVSPLVTTTNVTTTIDITTLEEGEHIVFARAKDNIGNWGDPQQTRFMVDKTPILVSIEEPEDEAVFAVNDVTVTGYALDSTVAISEVSYSLDGATPTSVTITEGTLGVNLLVKFEAPNTGLSDGPHTVVVTAVDTAANVGSGAVTFTVDTIAPSIILNPIAATSVDTIHITGSATDNMTGVAIVKWAVTPATTATPGSPTWKWDWFEAGVVDQFWGDLEEDYSFYAIFTEECEHIIWAKAVDAVGHVTYTSFGIDVDLYGPTVKSVDLNPVPTNENLTTLLTVEIESNKHDIVGYEWWIDGNDPGQGSGTWIGVTPSLNITETTTIASSVVVALSEGEHVIYVRAKDSFGNWSTWDETFGLGYLNYEEFSVDRSPMDLDWVIKPPYYCSSATVLFRGEADDSTSVITNFEYRYLLAGSTWTTWADITPAPVDGGYNELYEEFELELTLIPDGEYTVEVRCTDSAENQNVIDYTFIVDTTAPEISLMVKPIPEPGPLDGDVYENPIRLLTTVSDVTTWVNIMEYEITDADGGTTNVVESYLFEANPQQYNPWDMTKPIELFPYEETTILIRATDRAGNFATKTIVLTYVIPDVTKVIGKSGGTLEAPDGSKIVIPAGALERDTLINIHIPTEASLPSVEDECLYPTRFARIFSPEDLVFLKWVTITVPYYDYEIERLANDVYDLNPTEFENKLRLYYWDDMRWHRTDSEVDTANNLITAHVNHNGLFRIMSDYCAAVTGFKLYVTNNPFSPNGDGIKDQTIFKYKLPEDGKVTIKIYDMTGDLVRVLAENEEQVTGYYHEVVWTGENDFATYIGSGIYIFKFDFTANGTTETVIKPVGLIK